MEPRILTDPQVLADLLSTFGADTQHLQQPWSMDGEVAVAGGLGEVLGDGIRFEANGREWRVLQVGQGDEEVNQPSYRSDAQLRDAARVLPPVCFAPLVSQYTRLLRDPRWAVTAVPAIMSAMLHDPMLFHVMDANPLAPLSEYRVSAMTRWWGVAAKPVLRYENNTGRPLFELLDGTEVAAAAAGGEDESSTAERADGGQTESSVNSRMPLDELRRGYQNIKTVLTLIAATSAPYRCSRPPNASVSGCTARLVFCKDPSTIYIGLLLNTVLRELPRKVLCSMPVFRVIAEGWGNSPSLCEILQAAWEEYQDVLQEIRAVLGANSLTPSTEDDVTGHASSAASSSFASPTMGTTTRSRGVTGQQQLPPRRALPRLHLPAPSREGSDASSSGVSPASSPHAATATAEGGQHVQLGIPMSRARTSMASRTRLFGSTVLTPQRMTAGTVDGARYNTVSRTPAQGTAAAAALAAGGRTSRTEDANSTYHTEDANRICLESMQECAQSPEMLLWWARCRLLAYQLLDSTSRVGVESTRALEYFRQVWACTRLAREILEDDQEALLSASLLNSATLASRVAASAEEEEEEEARSRHVASPSHADGGDEATQQQRQQRSLTALQQRARRLYASLVGTIADLSKFWFSIRVAQSTLTAVGSSAPENNVIWSIVNATVPPRRRFQREEFASYAEHWQYALLVDDYVTQPMGFRVSTRGRTMVTQLLHVLSEYPTFYPALVTRTLAMLNRREMIVAELNGRLVAAVARCLRFYLPPMPPVLALPATAASTTAATITPSAVTPAPPSRRAPDTRSRRSSASSPESDVSSSASSATAGLDGFRVWPHSRVPRSPLRRATVLDDAAAATAAEEDTAGGAEAASSGLNYEAYVMRCTEDDEFDGDEQSQDEEEETSKRHPRLRRRAARRAAAARHEDEARRHEAAMPVLTTKAYDAILTCLDVLRMLVRNAHLSVNPMGILFAIPAAASVAEETATRAIPAASTSDGTPSRAPSVSHDDEHDGVASDTRRRALRYEPVLPKPQCDLYTLLHQLVYQTRYGPLATAALRLFSACVHYNVRDMVPLFTERGLLNTVLAIAHRPYPASAQHPHGEVPSPAGEPAPLLFALDMMEETGQPNVPRRDGQRDVGATTTAAAERPLSRSSPLVTAHPPRSLLVRYIPREDGYLNRASIRVVLPEFVEAMTVHQATHELFRKRLQWIPALLKSLTVSPALSTTTLSDIRALWEDEEAFDVADDAPVAAERGGDEEESEATTFLDTATVQQQYAQLACRSSLAYKSLLRGLLKSRRTSGAAAADAPQQGSSTPTGSAQGVDATLIRLLELCRLHLKREEVGYRILQGSVKDMSRVLTEVLQPSIILTSAFRPAIHHELSQLHKSVRQFAQAVRSAATHERPFLASSYPASGSTLASNTVTSDLAVSSGASSTVNSLNSSSREWETHGSASVSGPEATARMRRRQQSSPKSREDALQLLVRATELCRTFNNFFAFFSAMDWTGQRRGPRLARNNAERQESAQAMRDILSGTVATFHKTIQQLWFLMGCQAPLNLRGNPLSVLEQGVADGESSLLSYVQVVIGQCMHPRIFGDYLRSTQPSSTLEAVLRSTVRCILHHSTRSLFYLHQCAGDDIEEHARKRKGADWRSQQRAENEFLQDELKRLLSASEIPPGSHGGGAVSATSPRIGETEGTALTRHLDPNRRTEDATQGTAWQEPVQFELTDYPCRDLVSSALRPLSMGDGVFLRQLLEAWRSTTVSGGGSGSSGGFENVVGGPNRRDGDDIQWRGVFGELLRYVVDAIIVRAPVTPEEVPSLLRSVRSVNVHGGLPNGVLSLYDRSTETGAALVGDSVLSAEVQSGRAQASARDETSGVGHANAINQLMQSLLQDNRNYVGEPTTTWMTAEAWREATDGDARTTLAHPAAGAGVGSVPPPASPDALSAAAAVAGSSASGVAASSLPPLSSPPVSTLHAAAAVTSGLEDVVVTVDGEGGAGVENSQESSLASAVSSSVRTPTLQTTLAGIPPHLMESGDSQPLQRTAEGRVDAGHVGDAAERLSVVAQPAAAAELSRGGTPPPLFTPLNPTKALQQWTFMTLFNGRRNGMEQAMHDFFHIAAFRRESRARAVLPLNAAALVRALQEDLTTAFETAVRGVYADAVTRDQCCRGTAEIRESEPEKHARAVDEVVAARRRQRAASRRSTAAQVEGNGASVTSTADSLFEVPGCPWLEAKPRDLATMTLPTLTNIDECLEDINLGAAHRALWELAVLDAVSAGGSSNIRGVQDTYLWDLVKTLTRAAQLLILLSRLFLAPGAQTTHERPRYTMVSEAEGEALDAAAATASRAVVAAQSDLRRCLVYMGVLMMNFLEGCDSRVRGQHHFVVESLLYCVLDVWPALPGFPMLPHMYVSAVDLMSQLKADTFDYVRLQKLLNYPSPRPAKSAEAVAGGGRGRETSPGRRAADAHDDDSEDGPNESVHRERSNLAGFYGLDGSGDTAGHGGRPHPSASRPQRPSVSPQSSSTFPDYFSHEIERDRFPSPGPLRDISAAEAMSADLLRRRFMHLGQPYADSFHREADRTRFSSEFTVHDAPLGRPRLLSSLPTPGDLGSGAIPNAPLWERMLPWLCDVVTGNVFPLNALSETGLRLLRRRACKVLWSLWTLTKSPEQPFVLAYMLHRVLSDTRRNVVLLEYMGVLLSQIRGVVVVEALALTPLPRVVVRVVRDAIEAVGKEREEWERDAAAERAAATTVEAQRMLRDSRRRRRRMFAALSETLHGQLVSFLTLFQNTGSDAPLLKDRFKRTSATPQYAQMAGTQCNYFDATRSTFCWHGHQCHRHHVVPVNGQRNRDEEEQRFSLFTFGTGSQRVVDEMLTVLEHHGFESMPVFRGSKGPAQAEAAPKAHRAKHESFMSTPQTTTTTAPSAMPGAVRHVSPAMNPREEGEGEERASAPQLPPTQGYSLLDSGTTSHHPSLVEASARSAAEISPLRVTFTRTSRERYAEGEEDSTSLSASALVRHERLTPHGFVSMLEGAERQAAGAEANFAGAAVRTGGSRLTPRSRDGRAGVQRRAGSRAGDVNTRTDDNDDGGQARSPQQFEHLFHRHRQPEEPRGGSAVTTHQHIAALNRGAAGDAVGQASNATAQQSLDHEWGGTLPDSSLAAPARAPISDESGPLRHSLTNPLDGRRHRVDCLRRAIIPYYALFSREICEEVLRICLDFMAARLRDEAMDKAEAAEDDAYWAREQQQKQQQQEATASLQVRDAGSASTAGPAITEEAAHESRGTATGSSATTPSPLLHAPHAPSAFNSADSASAAAPAPAPSTTTARTAAASAVTHLAAQMKLPPVEVTECPVGEVMINFLLTSFFTYYHSCLHLVQTHRLSGGGGKATSEVLGGGANGSVEEPDALSVLCAYVTSVSLPNREKCIILCKLLLTDMTQIEDDIWRDMSRVLTSAVQVHHKAQKLTDKSHTALTAFHERRLHALAATAAPTDSSASPAAASAQSMTGQRKHVAARDWGQHHHATAAAAAAAPLASFSSPAPIHAHGPTRDEGAGRERHQGTRKAPAVDGEGEGQEVEEDVEGLHRYVVPVGIFLANLEAYIIRQPTAFYAAFQRHCEVRWVEARKGDVPAAWLGVWVQPRPDSRASARANTAASEVHVGRSARAGRRARTAAAASTATTSMPSIAPAVPSPKFVNRVSCFMQQLTRNVESGLSRASHGVEILAAVEQLPSVCAALLALPDNFPVPKSFASILATCTSASAISGEAGVASNPLCQQQPRDEGNEEEEASRAADRASNRIAVPPFIALLLYFCGTLSEADRSNPYDFAAGIDFAAELLAFNPIVVADAVVDTVQQLVTALEGIREGAEEAAGMGGDVEREQASATAAGTTPGDGHGTTRAREETNEAREARRRSLVRCLHGLLCFLECGSPRQATAALPARQRASQQQQHSGGKHVQEAFLRFYKHLGEQGLLPLLFRVCRLRTCEHGRDATSLLQLLHHQLLAFGEYRMATMLSPAQKAYVEQQQQGIQQRQRQTGMTGSGASRWPQMLGPGVSPAGAAFRRDPFPEGMPELATINAQAQRFASVDFGLGRPSSAYAQHRVHDVLLHMPDGVQVEVADEVAAAMASVRGGGEEEAEGNADASSTYSSSSSVSDYRPAAAVLRGANHLGDIFEPMRPLRRRHHPHHSLNAEEAVDDGEGDHPDAAEENALALAIEEAPLREHDPAVALADTVVMEENSAGALESGDVANVHQSASGSSPADEPSYEDEWENYTSSSVADEAERGGEGETLATLGLAGEDEEPLAQALTSGEANTAPGAQPGLFGALASPIWEFVMSEGNSSAEEAAEGVEGEDEEEEGEEEEDEEEGDDDGDGEEEEDEEVEEEYTSNLEEESEHAGYGSSDGDGDGSFLGDSGMEDRFLTPQVLGRMLGHRHGGHGGGGGGAGGIGGAGAAATAERAQTFAACAYHAILKTVRRLHRGNVVETERPMLPVLHATEEQAATEDTVSTHGNDASTRLRSEGPVSISSPAHRVPLSPPAMRNRTPSEQLMRRQRDSATPRDPLSTPHRQDSESAMMAAVMRAEETQTSTPAEVVAGAMASGSGAHVSRVAGESPELPTVTEAASNDNNNNSNNNADGVDDVTARILALFAAGSATAAASAPVPAIPDPVVAVAPSEPTEPEPWEGVLDVQFLNEMPEDVRSEILFDSMQTLRGPEEREVLGRRTRLYQGFLQAMPEAAQRHAMEVEARWVRVTRADDNASELYQTIISVDAETRRDLLLQCELELLQPYPELLREATELRAEVERQREELEAAQRAQEERRQRHREAVAQQTLNQRNPRRWTMESNDLLRDREERATAGSGLRVSAPGVQEMETVDGVMHVLFGATGPMYTIINHEVFLARRLYRCEAVLHGLQGPSNTQSVGPRMDGAVAGAAPSLPWVMSPLLEEVNYGPFRLRHGGGGGARGGNVLQRLPPTASPLALPFSSLASNESGSHQRLSPMSSSPLSPLGLGEAAPSPTSVVAAASAATGESETFPSGVPTAVAALSECIVPVQESPYHPLALPIPSVPEDVLFNCLELLRLRATAAFSLPFNATAGISCLDQQLQHLLQLLMGNPASAVRLLCQLLDVMTNTPTVADAPAETVAAATAPAVATQATPTAVELATNQMFIKGVTAFLVSLIKQNQAMAASFFLLPDGALNTETLKAVDAPMDALERRCAEYGLWNRLWRMCRQHIHIQGFLYSLDQLLRQLVRSQKMFHNAAEDNEITVSEDPLSAEPLSESLILHPRHPHRLRWTNIRRLPNYEEAGYVCNVCGVNPGFDYCFHCSSCQFDLCPCCSRERLTLEEMQLRISRSSALILMAVPETVTSMTAFLRHPLCRPNIATSVVQLMSRPLQECAARECASPLSTGTGAVSSFPSLSYASSNSRGTAHASLSAASPLQLLEQELVQMAETRVRAMKEARDVFRQEVHTIFHSKANASRGAGGRGAGAGGSLGAAPGALSMTGIGGGGPGRTAHHVGQPQLSIPDDYVFDTDTAMALLVKLDIKDSEGDAIQRLFEPYVATSGVEPRAFTMLWRASQAYLHDVSALLEHLTPQEVLPLPSCVSSILQTFCRYHLSEVHLRGVSASARALTGSRSNLAGETEHFLRASTKPSSVSDRAVKELSEQEDAAQWVTAVGTRLSEEGLNPTEEQQRRLPHVVRMILEENRVTLNTLLHWDSSLLKENFSFLKYEPNLIDFNFKLSDFRRRLGLRRGSNILLRVNRANCLLDSFKELQKQRSLGGQLHVRFEGEEGADAGGLTKEWLQILSEALVDERYALFVHSQDSASFQPNPFSSVNPNHLDYFQFAGVVVALAITHNVPIDIHFTRAFYRHIIGHRPVFADLQSFDPELYTNLNWIMENDVTNLALTFAVNYNRFGSVEEEELEPNGKNTMVTNANKQQYVRLLCEFHLTRRTEEQLLRFLKGFYSVIPRREVQCFTENELELVISGMPDIDVEDLRTHTVYEGYSTTSPQIRWFWEAVSAMTKEDLANLLQFTTGSSKVPHGGFGHLEGSNGRSLPFTISRWAVDKDDRLPQAHTCFNKIDLPVYASAALLKEKLMLAITYGSMGFTMV